MGYLPYQLVQDFVHQQYFSKMIHHMFYNDFMACEICFMMATPLLSRSQNSKTPAPPKTNTGPLEKEIPFGKHHFQVPVVVFQECIISYPKLCFGNIFAGKLVIGISNLQNLQNGLGNPITLSTCAAKILCLGSNLIRE